MVDLNKEEDTDLYSPGILRAFEKVEKYADDMRTVGKKTKRGRSQIDYSQMMFKSREDEYE